MLGPKRRKGDGQVPEGLYVIDTFNPNSIFYLSLGINCPNASDRVLGKGELGGDIFIHGNRVTIGCIPIRDYPIKRHISSADMHEIQDKTILRYIFSLQNLIPLA
jgi:murein L,D-transpeptidase YafK